MAAALSPLQAGRDLTWIAGGLTGVLALGLLVPQGLLATGWITTGPRQRRWHRRTAYLLILAVLAHVGGLYLYSPDDILDALLLHMPLYSKLGVASLAALVLVAALAAARRAFRRHPSGWRIAHGTLAALVAATAIGHTVLAWGALDGWAERLTVLAVMLAIAGALLQPLLERRRAREARRDAVVQAD